jgi:hypothetical protein
MCTHVKKMTEISSNIQALYAEAVEVSNAAEAFDDLVDFDTTSEFVHKIQATQKELIAHIVSLMEPAVLSAAASGAKHADVYTFKGSALFGEYNILFMLFGGVEQDRREQLAQFGFQGCYDTLMHTLLPFYIKHTWDRSTNDNIISVFWE